MHHKRVTIEPVRGAKKKNKEEREEEMEEPTEEGESIGRTGGGPVLSKNKTKIFHNKYCQKMPDIRFLMPCKAFKGLQWLDKRPKAHLKAFRGL